MARVPFISLTFFGVPLKRVLDVKYVLKRNNQSAESITHVCVINANFLYELQTQKI